MFRIIWPLDSPSVFNFGNSLGIASDKRDSLFNKTRLNDFGLIRSEESNKRTTHSLPFNSVVVLFSTRVHSCVDGGLRYKPVWVSTEQKQSSNSARKKVLVLAQDFRIHQKGLPPLLVLQSGRCLRPHLVEILRDSSKVEVPDRAPGHWTSLDPEPTSLLEQSLQFFGTRLALLSSYPDVIAMTLVVPYRLYSPATFDLNHCDGFSWLNVSYPLGVRDN